MFDGFREDLTGKLLRFWNHHFPSYIFIHINKTAGSSIERALNLRFEHKTAIEKRMALGKIRWERAFKFAFVRNPWDRAVSHYHYRVKTNQTGLGTLKLPFRDWLIAVYVEKDGRYRDQPKMFLPQWSWISDASGYCMIDFIGRFEALQSDIRKVATILDRPIILPHLKRSEHGDYRRYYDAETAAIIADAFAHDVVHFGYEFE